MILWDDATETAVQPVPTCAVCTVLAAPAFPLGVCGTIRTPWTAPIPVGHRTVPVCRDCAHTIGVRGAA